MCVVQRSSDECRDVVQRGGCGAHLRGLQVSGQSLAHAAYRQVTRDHAAFIWAIIVVKGGQITGALGVAHTSQFAHTQLVVAKQV